jgi:UDP-2-acetamido-3-amino-2,3-dideoxy-glucuronate N-acetyltransferase
MRVALIGCGAWGRNLARNLHELGGLSAIVDPSPLAGEVARELDVAVRDADSVFADPAITAIAIASPASTHFAVATAALKAGKDVFVEKPIALHASEGEQLEALAVEMGRLVMVGHLLHYHPVFLALLERVRAGEIGQIRHIVSNRFNFGVVRTYENVVWSFAPHDISMVLALAGDLPETVSAHGSAVLQTAIPDIATLHLGFPGGATATIGSSWLNPQKEQKLIVVGSEGMAVFDDRQPWDNKLAFHRNKVTWNEGVPILASGGMEYVFCPPAEPLRAEMTHFLSVIQSRGKPRTDAAEAIRVLRVLEAAQESLERDGVKVGIGDSPGNGT